MMKNRFLLLLTGLLPVWICAQVKSTDKADPYTALFKGKTVKTAKGLITLHKMGGKVYFEFPENLYGKDMLLGSVTEAVSNANDAVAGEQAHDPLCIHFTRIDSTVYLRAGSWSYMADGDTGLQNAIRKNNLAPILAAFKILATAPDSQRVVFDATSFFVNGSKQMDPFLPPGGLYGRTTAFKPENSLPGDIMAFDDNVAVTSYMSYGVTSTFFGFLTEQDRPATIIMKRSLLLLPEKPMRPRISDPRVGVFYTGYNRISSREDGMKPLYYANHWRLEPADPEAFKQGVLTEPVKPIVFYIDNKFPAHWLPYIREGVEDWNKAFEKIGFRNAVVTRSYPENDSTFDPNNIKFTCVKYAPTDRQNAMGPSWVDPRTGEILSAGVYLYHGMIDLLSDWLFVQTAAADKRVRTKNIPMDIMGRGIRYVTAHEVGHCLGLMHNMGASSAFPVDSLRSPSFTQRYGTTPSIMDYARFNFIAQPGDVEKGVSLTPPEMGVYDYHAIKWLYAPVPGAASPEAELPVLEQWVAEKIKDPMYRYGRQQLYGIVDPNAQTEDLGDDQVKATRYAIQNLQFIMNHVNDWVGKEDSSYVFRRKLNFGIINIHFYWYWMHVLHNIGGIYQYEKYEGDPFPAWKVVPRETQRKSLLFALEALENSSWMNNKVAEENMDDINGDPGNYIRTFLFPYLMRWTARIGLSESKENAGGYTRSDAVADIFQYVWGGVLAGKKPSVEKRTMQALMVQALIQNAGVLPKKSVAPNALQPEEIALLKLENQARLYNRSGILSPMMRCGVRDRHENPEEESGMGFLPRISWQSDDVTHIYYGWLLQCRDILEKVVPLHTGDVKTEYQYLHLLIKKALKGQS